MSKVAAAPSSFTSRANNSCACALYAHTPQSGAWRNHTLTVNGRGSGLSSIIELCPWNVLLRNNLQFLI